MNISDKTEQINGLNSNRLDFVDALRGLAICMVIFFHTQELVKLPAGYFQSLSLQGTRGVQLFFLISAFTIFLSYSRRHQREKRPVLNFFIRRFFRIAPLFYIVLIYYLIKYGLHGVSTYWLGGDQKISALNILTNVFFINAWFPKFINSINPIGWTVAVEMGFYFLVPFLFQLIKSTKTSIYWFVGSLLFAISSNLFLRHYFSVSEGSLNSSFLYYWLPYQFPIFMLGIVFYFLYRSKINISKNILRSILLFSIVSLFLILDIGGKYLFNPYVYALAFFGLLLGLSKIKFALLVNPISIFIGKISYSLYLTHYIIVLLLIESTYLEILSPNIFTYIIVSFSLLCASAIVSIVTYYIIEIPFQKLGRKIIQKFELNATKKSTG